MRSDVIQPLSIALRQENSHEEVEGHSTKALKHSTTRNQYGKHGMTQSSKVSMRSAHEKPCDCTECLIRTLVTTTLAAPDDPGTLHDKGWLMGLR